MSDEEKDKLKPHDFDGIQEYDNQLPSWWLNSFIISILFAGIYFAYYQIGEGQNLMDSYREERIKEIADEALKASERKILSEDELLAIAEKPEVIELGASHYQTKCAACHAADGGGLVGPNLTDDFSVHGNKMGDIAQVVRNGVPAKGMPVWGALMSEDEIIAVSAYVRSLHGKKTVAPKAPEGERFK